MNKSKRLLKLTAIGGLLSCTLWTLGAHAQLYLNDYTTLHEVPTTPSTWVYNQSVYRDNVTQQYYVAQIIRPYGNQSSYLGFAICDAQMNVIKSWQYNKQQPAVTGFLVADMDEMPGAASMILVGDYVQEGVISAPFALSLNKTTGAINWFRLYPTYAHFTGVEAVGTYAIITGQRQLTNPSDRIHPVSNTAGTIMRIDANGNPVWAYQFEDDKYQPYGYSIFNDMADVIHLGGSDFVAVGNTNNFIGGNVNDIWDCDATVVRFNANGVIASQQLLGNIAALGAPKASGGLQNIQYEKAMSVTYLPGQNTIGIAGVRYEHPQTYISGICPIPTGWGLWATKFNYAASTAAWSNRYQGTGSNYYRSYYSKIEEDGTGKFGISYNIVAGSNVIMKLDNLGGVQYSRDHFVTAVNGGGRVIHDITRGFQYNNIMAVGRFQPDVTQYNSANGWNVEAYDNIQQNCQMMDFNVDLFSTPYEVGQIESRAITPSMITDNLMQSAIGEKNTILCQKKLLAPPKLTGLTSDLESDQQLQIYPNPSSDILNYSLGNSFDLDNAHVIITNMQGQTLMYETLSRRQGHLNVAELPSGLYFVKFQNDEQSELLKFAKQ